MAKRDEIEEKGKVEVGDVVDSDIGSDKKSSGRNQIDTLIDEDEEEDDDMAGSGLLQSLTTDIEKYHKKVQKVKKAEDDNGEERERVPELDMELGIRMDMEMQSGVVADPVKPTAERRKRTIAVVEHVGSGESNSESDDSDDDRSYTRGGKRKKRKVDRKLATWVKEEDDAIVYYKEEMKYSWKKIEQLLNFKHSWQAIQMRYLRNHKSRNEEWSKFMEVKLINAVRKDWENRWKRISVELGKHFSSERCLAKNVDICKKIETDFYSQIFKNKEMATAYENPTHDIKDAEQHKKLLLVYMGLDSISYEDDPEEVEEPVNAVTTTADSLKPDSGVSTPASTVDSGK